MVTKCACVFSSRVQFSPTLFKETCEKAVQTPIQVLSSPFSFAVCNFFFLKNKSEKSFKVKVLFFRHLVVYVRTCVILWAGKREKMGFGPFVCFPIGRRKGRKTLVLLRTTTTFMRVGLFHEQRAFPTSFCRFRDGKFKDKEGGNSRKKNRDPNSGVRLWKRGHH